MIMNNANVWELHKTSKKMSWNLQFKFLTKKKLLSTRKSRGKLFHFSSFLFFHPRHRFHKWEMFSLYIFFSSHFSLLRKYTSWRTFWQSSKKIFFYKENLKLLLRIKNFPWQNFNLFFSSCLHHKYYWA